MHDGRDSAMFDDGQLCLVVMEVMEKLLSDDMVEFCGLISDILICKGG
jgi:hypothetical protein